MSSHDKDYIEKFQGEGYKITIEHPISKFHCYRKVSFELSDGGNAYEWVNLFRDIMLTLGFSEQTVNEYLGEWRDQ